MFDDTRVLGAAATDVLVERTTRTRELYLALCRSILHNTIRR